MEILGSDVADYVDRYKAGSKDRLIVAACLMRDTLTAYSQLLIPEELGHFDLKCENQLVGSGLDHHGINNGGSAQQSLCEGVAFLS